MGLKDDQPNDIVAPVTVGLGNIANIYHYRDMISKDATIWKFWVDTNINI